MNAIERIIKAVLLESIPQMVRDFFARGDGISCITALGTITSDYVAPGLPKVRFDRDDAASGKGYAYLASYTPAANDRVQLLRVGHDWLIQGKVVNS